LFSDATRCYSAPVTHFIAELVTRSGKDERVVSLTINNQRHLMTENINIMCLHPSRDYNTGEKNNNDKVKYL